MSQHNTKHSIACYSVILALLAMVITFTGCKDDLINPVEIPDAEVELVGEVTFKPLVPTVVQTRAAEDAPEGAAYKGIKSLYVFFFDAEGKLVPQYCGDVDFKPSPSEGTHEHVTFTKRVQAGQYYIYAVANISDAQKSLLEQVTTIEALRNFKLDWNDDIANDLEMFGVFRLEGTENNVPDNETFESDELLTVTPFENHIHSWVRRAASKVTIDFDVTKLKDGVTVYIKKATLKDVASGALLGSPSAVGSNGFVCRQSDYSINYGQGDTYSGWPSLTRTKVFSPEDVWGDDKITSFHDENAKALPCYENMQGEPEGKSKLQDSDGDGVIDSDIENGKDGVENGTYLEVEGYYVANRPEYKSHGKIIYRFMLGQDVEKNFDIIRNHHYKITMQFKGYGNDVDWHIEYVEHYLDVTYPKDVNYQGKFFSPDLDYTNVYNAGHAFSEQNVITVTSFATDWRNQASWVAPEITYTYYSYDNQTEEWTEDEESAGWLTCSTPDDLTPSDTSRPYSFVASMAKPTDDTVNSLFPDTALGEEDSPYNLSHEAGTLTGDSGETTDIENTANCYMVGAPGWYCFPLVYGNAITGSEENEDAYSPTHFVNYLNQHISSPYIKDDTKFSTGNMEVKLIWQDAENLVTPGDIKYDPNLFGGKGGIKFKIGTLQEGNAVIALIDTKASEDEYVNINRGEYGKSGSTKAVWSWHIWATRFGSDSFEETISILNHDGESYELMPVHLGWCSGGGKIRYYKRRKCDITFKVGGKEITRTIEQYPHFVLPRGDHPYYQWGRKDPFVGTNENEKNKARWTHDGTKYTEEFKYNPPRLYNEPGQSYQDDKRHHTKECLNVLIKNPDKWHNPPREPKKKDSIQYYGFKSLNKSYVDLWSLSGKKTVYDPCPPGYQVESGKIFTGFTTTGGNAEKALYWYDVLESNMLSGYYTGSVNTQVMEFYTDQRKLQSITFPVTGYRDYDANGSVINYPGSTEFHGFVWTNEAVEDVDPTNAYHLKFLRNDLADGDDWKDRGKSVAPRESFFNCDGFAVRPVKIVSK